MRQLFNIVYFEETTPTLPRLFPGSLNPLRYPTGKKKEKKADNSKKRDANETVLFALQGCRLTENGLADTLAGIAREFPRVPGVAVPANGERQFAACERLGNLRR